MTKNGKKIDVNYSQKLVMDGGELQEQDFLESIWKK